jgi:hypothetical protein
MPYVYVYPLATSLALYLFIVSSALYFIVNTHLHPTVFFPFGNVVSSQVLLF